MRSPNIRTETNSWPAINSTTISLKYSIHYGEVFSISDVPQESPARRGFTLSYLGKTLLSRIDPVIAGERLASDIAIKERTLYLCPSPIYGYGLPLLLEKLKSALPFKNSAVLCIEADEKLFEISQRAIDELIGSAGGFSFLALTRVSTDPVSMPEEICGFVRKTWGIRIFRRVEVIRLSGGWQLFQKLYDDVEASIRRELALEWGNAMTLIKLGRLYTRNLIRNLSLLPSGENAASLDFGAMPLLVLGAGPSLDSLLDRLSALSCEASLSNRSFKIICVDTCLAALHERGIQPDLVVILESQHWNLKDFSGARGRKTDLAMDLSALPASMRVLEGKRYFFATPWTELNFLKRLEKAGLMPEYLPPLGSVGLSAVALALKISSGPVLTGGIDFSYTIDAYHARSTPAHAELLRKQTRLSDLIDTGAVFREGTFTAISKAGKPVRSDPVMRKYRDLFEQEFGGNDRLVDITGQGLPLGIRTVSIDEAFAVLSGETQTGILHNNSPLNNSPKVFQNETIKTFIQNETKTLQTLKNMLTRRIPAEPERLSLLLDSADYLWAHFPDCAGAGGRRPALTDLGFLKRVRTEIEPFIKLWEMANLAIYPDP